MAWPKRTNWFAWIAGIVIFGIIVVVGIVVMSNSTNTMSKDLGDTYKKASEE